ncbi:hypothetical protein BASA50_008869 [Batrachochytrium salamandrivorans]|uniref:Uncharacterized protein n=1 Tax=Batrachochytrium salamandrivorans TaxID=1357716 RepID=A0ABQ8F269_9FUNG|nr:hypothetical protein BASA50_008869 [Batrachochytrium salamandrivorans]
MEQHITATLALSTGNYADQSFLERRAGNDDASSTADRVSGLEQSSGDDQNRNFANTLASLHKTPPPIPPRSKPQDQQRSVDHDSESDGEGSTQEMLDPSKASFWESETSSQPSSMPEMSPDTLASQLEITSTPPPKPKGNDHQESNENDPGSGGWTQEAFDQFITSLRASNVPPPIPLRSNVQDQQRSVDYDSESDGEGSTQEMLDPSKASFWESGTSSQPSSMPEMLPDTLASQLEITSTPPPKPKGNDRQKSAEDDSGSEISGQGNNALEGTARKDRGRGETTKYRPSKKPTSLR